MNKEIRKQLKGYELTKDTLDERFKGKKFKTDTGAGTFFCYDALYYGNDCISPDEYKLHELVDWIKTLLGTGANVHHPILYHINKEKAVEVVNEIIEIIKEDEKNKKQKIKKHYDKEYTIYDMVESSRDWPIIDEMKKQEKESMEKQEATLKLADGREIKVEISEDELRKLIKKDPYAIWERTNYVYHVNECGVVTRDELNELDEGFLAGIEGNSNIYNNYDFAEKCARADLLMRNLRRFAIQHNEIKKGTTAGDLPIWSIVYDNSRDYDGKNFSIRTYSNLDGPNFGSVFFTYETCKKAIIEFKDELIWYFTEYLTIYE